MKKRLIFLVLAWAIVPCTNAQIYPYDSNMQMPTRDLYDIDMMSMAIRAAAETRERRKQEFHQYAQMATEAYNNKNWGLTIHYVDLAFSTQFVDGDLYYIRGFAYEALGYYRDARKDYKKGKRYGSAKAARALESLRQRR